MPPATPSDEFLAALARECRTAGVRVPTPRTIRNRLGKALDEEGRIRRDTIEILTDWLITSLGLAQEVADHLTLLALREAEPATNILVVVGERDSPRMARQSARMGCAAACGRQLLAEVAGLDLTEDAVASVAQTSDIGTHFDNLGTAMAALDPPGQWAWVGTARAPTELDLDQLLPRTPFVAEVFIFLGNRTGHHALIVDRIEHGIIEIRDPDGSRMDSKLGSTGRIWFGHFLAVWTGNAVARAAVGPPDQPQ